MYLLYACSITKNGDMDMFLHGNLYNREDFLLNLAKLNLRNS